MILWIQENWDLLIQVITGAVTIASALCALIPGGGTIKKLLGILALNIKNAKMDSVKQVVDALAESKKEKK